MLGLNLNHHSKRGPGVPEQVLTQWPFKWFLNLHHVLHESATSIQFADTESVNCALIMAVVFYGHWILPFLENLTNYDVTSWYHTVAKLLYECVRYFRHNCSNHKTHHCSIVKSWMSLWCWSLTDNLVCSDLRREISSSQFRNPHSWYPSPL